MNKFPLEIINKIMSFLPILTKERELLNNDIIKTFYLKKWFNYYESIEEYSSNPNHDDYYLNWFENDLIFILNNKTMLMHGINKEFSSLLKQIHVTGPSLEDMFPMKESTNSEKMIRSIGRLLTIKQIIRIDYELELYNNRVHTGHSCLFVRDVFSFY
jgi:hypothetical protein